MNDRCTHWPHVPHALRGVPSCAKASAGAPFPVAPEDDPHAVTCGQCRRTVRWREARDRAEEGMPRLEDWRMVSSPYEAPEIAGRYVEGKLHNSGNPRRPDGHPITTSRVVGASGRVVTTRSGSRYLLGEPDPRYLGWMERKGLTYDPEAPVAVR